MSKSRFGKIKDDIFSKKNASTPQEEIEKTEEGKARGRPQEHKESWSKVTVVLLNRQIHLLDNLASDIRLNTGSAVSRAEVIRAVIEAVAESGIDLSRSRGEEEIKNMILEKLKS